MIPGKVGTCEAGYSVLETADGPLLGRAQAALAAGSSATLSIRPERIRLEAAETQINGVNRLTGRIAEAIYMGRGRKYVVETASGATLTIAQPAAGAGTARRSTGDRVAATFAPEDAVIIVDS